MTSPLSRMLDRCPHCGSDRIDPVADGETENFLCLNCFRCWHVELGRVHRVDPTTCLGCHYPDICMALYTAKPENGAPVQ